MIRTIWGIANLVVGTLVFAPLAILGGLLGVKRQAYYDWCTRT